ncbi:cyclase family protein [Agromyces aurantiacus]|uniref:Cyclase family protein n=1 Tax=Agromyces aurantiacus TaxID=165814 RepID=A0ABV9R3W8_9MICO|nr:cyclase family protein [Agromyces aurantiacus]MBM7503481.1 kynurenine formamidase [Agromyces aurantiacus]
MTEYRAVFDANIRFVNGGGLRAEGFRLDVPSRDLGEGELARLLVRHLGLALVGSVEFSNLDVVAEPHKGSRGVAESGIALAERAGAADAAPARAAAARGELVDLSHPIRDGLVTYPGIPAPTIVPHLTREASREHYAPGTEFEIDLITMAGNTGTYLDSPFHRYEHGGDLASLELATLVGLPAEVFHLADASERGIPAEVFFERELADAAVLLHTGWSRHFGTPAYAHGSPFLSEAGARHLADAGVALVGIDALNIDDTEGTGTRPAHSILLAAGIHVVEHLTGLDRVPARGARFTAVPPKVERFGTFPVRAFAELPVDV